MKKFALKAIRFYQLFLSPLSGKHCRFYPSCSEYAHRSLEKYGILRGVWKSAGRIMRCGPWAKGGVDLP